MRVFSLFLASCLLCGCQHARQSAFDRGYWQGASDAIKRHYWSQQERERPAERRTRTIHYVIDEPLRTEDGRNLVPGKQDIAVKE